MDNQGSKVLKCDNYHWDSVKRHQYKSDGGGFSKIHRYALLDERFPELNFHTRYFEIEPGGYSSLEYHRHPHSVVVIRGKGSVIIGNDIHQLSLHDIVFISPETIHQFHADKDEYLGFLCMVDRYRDKPVIPDSETVEKKIRNENVRSMMKF